MSRPYSSLEEVYASLASKTLDDVTRQVDPSFAQDLGAIATSNVFERLWMRQGLDRRSRSLVTLGMLLALRATEEFGVHTMVGINNGLTIAEIEEVLYHATAYTGLPAVNAARASAAKALRKEGLLGAEGARKD